MSRASDAQRNSWLNPEIRAKRLAGIKRTIAQRTASYRATMARRKAEDLEREKKPKP